jgi:hypothetical protein
MATRKVKLRISIKEFSMDFEGTQDLGLQIQQGFTEAIGGLMNAQARMLAAQPEPGQVIDAEVSDSGTARVNGQESQNAYGEKGKQPKQRRARSGVSLTNLLRGLKKEGYFSQARPVSDILERLKDKGHSNFTESNISARMQELTKKNELYRDKNGQGVYVYKDSQFDEAQRSEGPSEQPAE